MLRGTCSAMVEFGRWVFGGLIYGEEGARCWSGKRGNSGTRGGEGGEGTRGHSEMMKSDLMISSEAEMEMEWC